MAYFLQGRLQSELILVSVMAFATEKRESKAGENIYNWCLCRWYNVCYQTPKRGIALLNFYAMLDLVRTSI